MSLIVELTHSDSLTQDAQAPAHRPNSLWSLGICTAMPLRCQFQAPQGRVELDHNPPHTWPGWCKAMPSSPAWLCPLLLTTSVGLGHALFTPPGQAVAASCLLGPKEPAHDAFPHGVRWGWTIPPFTVKLLWDRAACLLSLRSRVGPQQIQFTEESSTAHMDC